MTNPASQPRPAIQHFTTWPRADTSTTQSDQTRSFGQGGSSSTFAPHPVEILAHDGHALRGTLYEPQAPCGATLLALPGIGVPQRVFRHVGAWMSGRGVRVLSIDYRGIGQDIGASATRSASLSTWARTDAPAALRFVKRQFAGPVVLLAHSFAGQALGLSDELHDVDGAILVGSQLGHPMHWDGSARLRVELFWRALLPLGCVLSEPIPKWVVKEKLPRGVARQWGRWGRARDWLFSEYPQARTRYAAFRRPILACSASDDPIAPPRAVGALLDCFTSAPISRLALTPSQWGGAHIGHMGMFRPQHTDTLWQRWFQFATQLGDPLQN